MDREWNDSQPIYRQLRDRVVAMILDGVLKEGDPLPSVRHVAAEYRVNPLTVLKGYQQLVDDGLVETRRGLGMFINVGHHSAARPEGGRTPERREESEEVGCR
jgi:GntR family transcriptional regulator